MAEDFHSLKWWRWALATSSSYSCTLLCPFFGKLPSYTRDSSASDWLLWFWQPGTHLISVARTWTDSHFQGFRYLSPSRVQSVEYCNSDRRQQIEVPHQHYQNFSGGSTDLMEVQPGSKIACHQQLFRSLILLTASSTMYHSNSTFVQHHQYFPSQILTFSLNNLEANWIF